MLKVAYHPVSCLLHLHITYWSRLIICKHCLICFIYYYQNYYLLLSFGELTIICSLSKGVFNWRPALPRCSTTCDVLVVFVHMKSLKAIKQCDLKRVLYCIAVLLCIAISAISRWCVTVLNNAVVDVSLFGPHLTRSASSTHCKREGLSVK